MLILTILLILAWKTAGWWGLDRWLLPLIVARKQPISSVSKK
jgi:thiosulfate dehydrogenase [quinone] large subunit